MGYRQLRHEDRIRIATLRQEGYSLTAIASRLGKSTSTISREVKRNWDRTCYWAGRADEKARWRRRRCRRHLYFSDGELELVNAALREDHSPEQIARTLKKAGTLSISHETIYKHVWRDKAAGGKLWKHLRQQSKKRRKRYGGYDSRGKLAGKRSIDERPASINARIETGHWEIDTVLGRGKHCVLTLVERVTGYLLMGKLSARTAAEVNQKVVEFIKKHSGKIQTITSDNGTEFHGYKIVEEMTGVPFYFAHPHHSWERGTNENTNGLIRQYLPKGISFCRLTQEACDRISRRLNTRPRKRHDFETPERLFSLAPNVALQP